MLPSEMNENEISKIIVDSAIEVLDGIRRVVNGL
jgi:hypothetical protein